MSIVRRRAATMLVAFLAVGMLATGTQPRTANADDPSVNQAITEQQQMEALLAQQRAQLADLRREQADLTESLASLATDLDAVGLEITAARRELERLGNILQQSRSDLERYRLQIANLATDLASVSDEIDKSRQELAGREALLQEHLRSAYETSQTSILEVLLSTESFGEASSQLSYMLTLSDEDRQLAEEIRAERERLKVRRQTLKEGRATLGDLRDSEAERVAALDEQQRELDAARAALEQKEKQLEELQAEQRAQLAAAARDEQTTSQLIEAQKLQLAAQDDLVTRLKAEADKLDIAYRGRFAWPERGAFMVTQEFGSTPFNWHHTGLDMSYITPHCGGPIYAAADGVVLADERPNIAYGDTAIGVVIGHSQRLQTWYWHMSREIVTVGQQVVAGDLIGYEGATGIATGCHLHFQVMLDGNPVNPRNYLP
jgi:murein DD-endopeptidase MepM/ murein hydrolase activator NlpD